MTELELYKFVGELEYHIYDWDNDILLFIPTWRLDEFQKLLGESYFEEDGIECTMKFNYFCFEMTAICKEFGINQENIFEDKKF